MPRHLSTAILALVATAVVVAGGVGVTTVAAQTPTTGANNSTTTASTPTPTPTEPGPARTLIQVDEQVSVVSYDYDGDLMTVRVRVEDLPTLVAISDVMGAIQDEGAARSRSKQVLLEQGTHELTMDVEEYRGAAAVAVSTSEGSVYLSTGLNIDPFSNSGGATGWLGGAGLSVGAFVAAALYKLRKEKTGVEVADE